MYTPVTVEIRDCTHARLRQLERFVGTRLYRKGTDPHWFLDLYDRETADMMIVNLNADGYTAFIMGEQEPKGKS